MITSSNMNDGEFNNDDSSLYSNTNIYADTTSELDFVSTKVNSIYPLENTKWVESDLVISCQLCDSIFSSIKRKHHCRACGGVFCNECCNKMISIPEKYIRKPQEDINIKVTVSCAIRRYTNTLFQRNSPKNEVKKDLVCNNCFNKIKTINKISHLITICSFLDLESLYVILKASRNYNNNWYNASIHQISKFRQIQYIDIHNSYDKWEMYIIWLSKSLLVEHSIWMLSILKNTFQLYYTDNKINYFEDLRKIINEKRITSCKKILCSEKCNKELCLLDFLDLLNFINLLNSKNLFWTDNNIKSFIIFLLEKIKIYEHDHKYIMPLLCNIFGKLSNVDKSLLDLPFLTTLFNLITCDNNMLNSLISEIIYLRSCKKKLNDLSNFILFCENFINLKLGSKKVSELDNMVIVFRKLSTSSDISKINLHLPLVYPLDYAYKIIKITDIQKIHSNTEPLKITVDIKNDEGIIKKDVVFFLKIDDSLRKEQIVASLIILLLEKLSLQSKNNKLMQFEQIPSYQIKLISSNIGFIECVENSITLRDITEIKYTLQNYVLENNSDQKIDSIKRRFLQSLSISCCLSYLLGLGDRHLDNIMVTKRGQLFHIDFGYLLDNPKLAHYIAPSIKMTNEMIDFIGGTGLYYNEFTDFMIKVYDIMRLYKNEIVNYYEIIAYEGFIEWKNVRDRLEYRFMNGLETKDIKITLINEVETSNNWKSRLIDKTHNVSKIISNFSVSKLFTKFF